MAVLAQAGTKGERLGYDKDNVAEVSQSQAPLLSWTSVQAASPPGSGEYAQGLDIVLSSCLQPSCTACLLHVPLPDSKAVHMAVLRVQQKSCGLGKDEKS